MPATATQKLNVLFRDNDIRCKGIPELGITCNRRITSTDECRFDARLADWMKHEGDDRHPDDELRCICKACDKIKTTRDAKLSAKDKRIRGITKQGRKARIPSRGFSKVPDGYKRNWKTGRMEKIASCENAAHGFACGDCPECEKAARDLL